MKIRLTNEAREFFLEQIEYIKSVNPQASERVFRSIFNTIDTLKANRRLGKKTFRDDVRSILSRKYSYKILYQINVEQQEIIVFAIFNTRMDVDRKIEEFFRNIDNSK